MTATGHWPTELKVLRAEKALKVTFDDGRSFTLPAEYLRVESPSAEVQGHSPSERVTLGGRRHVAVIGVEQVGNYAVKLSFDDLHDTGLYTWDYLYHLGTNHDRIWQAYLEALAAKGLSRDP